MKRKLYLTATLLLLFAFLLPLAACGGKNNEPELANTEGAKLLTEVETLEKTTDPVEESVTEPREAASVTAPGEGIAVTTEAGAAAETTAGSAVPSTPAEVLAAYAEVMNKAKKDTKYMRKLEYQFLDKDQMMFELDLINNPSVLNWINDNLMTTREKGLQQDQYINGVTDMIEYLPVMHTSLGCMVKDPGVFSKAMAKRLSNGSIELTLVMKPEDNPEPAQPGATTSPSVTGQMFDPLSKAGIDDLLYKARFFITTEPVFSTRFYDCKAVLVYDPDTMRAVLLRHDYHTRLNVTEGRILFISAKGSGVLEAVTVCDNFKY